MANYDMDEAIRRSILDATRRGECPQIEMEQFRSYKHPCHHHFRGRRVVQETYVG